MQHALGFRSSPSVWMPWMSGCLWSVASLLWVKRVGSLVGARHGSKTYGSMKDGCADPSMVVKPASPVVKVVPGSHAETIGPFPPPPCRLVRSPAHIINPPTGCSRQDRALLRTARATEFSFSSTDAFSFHAPPSRLCMHTDYAEVAALFHSTHTSPLPFAPYFVMQCLSPPPHDYHHHITRIITPSSTLCTVNIPFHFLFAIGFSVTTATRHACQSPR